MANITVQADVEIEVAPGSSQIFLIAGDVDSIVCGPGEIISYGQHFLGMEGMWVEHDEDGLLFIPNDNISYIKKFS